MPIYDYACRSCGHRFEARQRFSDPPLTICPRCEGDIVRLLLPPIGIHFKGNCWHITDYARSNGSARKEEGAESQAAEARTEKPAETAAA
jgi:putative FmdB family regulatory protein